MIKIHFESNSWEELRLQIQEFAVAHLHAKFSDLKLENGQVGGYSDVAIPAAEPAPKTRGKKSAKQDAPKTEPTGSPAGGIVDSKSVNEGSTPSEPAKISSPAHTLEECTTALQKVWDKHGMETSLECLTRFGAKRARELDPKSYADFIAFCGEKAQ